MTRPDFVGNPDDVKRAEDAKAYDRPLPFTYDPGSDTVNVEAAHLAVGGEDITALMGPGGSAFAHLTEDADTSSLVADWSLTVGDLGGSNIRLALGPDLGITHSSGNNVDIYADGSGAHIDLYGTGGTVGASLAVDADGDLTVNGAKVATL